MAGSTSLPTTKRASKSGWSFIRRRVFPAVNTWARSTISVLICPKVTSIRKDKKMYYAFFAGNWKGTLELRGLDDRAYHVVDYVEGKDFGIVQGPVARLSADFSKHLLLEATPQ